MSEGNAGSTPVTRTPSGYGEDLSFMGAVGAVGIYVSRKVAPYDADLAPLILMFAPILGQLLGTWVRNRLGESVAVTLGLRVPKGTVVAPLIAAIVLACGMTPAYAQDAAPPPVVGVGNGSLSLYVFDVGWPNGLGLNGAEFVRFRFTAEILSQTSMLKIQPLGAVCLIPKVGGALGPLCSSITLGGA